MTLLLGAGCTVPNPSWSPESGVPPREGAVPSWEGGTEAAAHEPDGGARLDRRRPEARSPDLPEEICASGTKQACGPCNQGTITCLMSDGGMEVTCTLPPGTCQPGTTEPCPNGCGERACGPSCTFGACTDGACVPGTTEPCPGGCGERICGPSCTFGACSNTGLLLKPSGKACWSSQHCPPNSPNGQGRCVACWLKCGPEGNPVEDDWCAGGKCQSCGPLAPSCS